MEGWSYMGYALTHPESHWSRGLYSVLLRCVVLFVLCCIVSCCAVLCRFIAELRCAVCLCCGAFWRGMARCGVV